MEKMPDFANTFRLFATEKQAREICSRLVPVLAFGKLESPRSW
jgi:hypothetical protein